MIKFLKNIFSFINNSVGELFSSNKKKKQKLKQSSKKQPKTVDDWMSENNVDVNSVPSVSEATEEKNPVTEIDNKTIIEELQKAKANTKKKKLYQKKEEINDPDELEKVTGFLANAKRNFTNKEFLERKIEVLQFLKELKDKKLDQNNG